MAGVGKRLKHAWNVFSGDNSIHSPDVFSYGSSTGHRADRQRFSFANERSIVTSIYTRIAIDVASVEFRHIRMDDQARYLEDMDSGLNNCLTLEANIDQSGRALIQDIVQSICDEGVVAVVPVKTGLNPNLTGSYEIEELRVGTIVAWYPKHVRVRVYDDERGIRQEVTVLKKIVAIVENPLYSVMNEPNSTLQRLLRKLSLLDAVDEQSASGKLDLIVQLPYVVKSETRRAQAEQRRKDIEFQLKGSKYGIAYTDGTEKITQLNRPAENNLLSQIEYLTKMLYGQLGITEEIMNGTADEKAMLNYLNRTVEPIAGAIVDEFRRKFLTKTARTQRQSVAYFRDPFRLVPVKELAEIADKFTRNEITSSNEIRQVVGLKPSNDPKADELRNSNMPHEDDISNPVVDEEVEAEDNEIDGAMGEIETMIDQMYKDLGIEEDPNE